ncbi:hypothetical protein [Spirosoma endophyticum]|uniref:Outer membrane protein beta-barrel domain-containing protein n=1 Tax=Spirosoma endophyticum TaxID=662367 RepID=A0A1I1Z9K9_9BACT|nr:hypothetical protein [Spirosoma endophyticum]SFE28232.1 hypothetical protein SAMN05216167_11251 [Spirosoma endophyticum]
MKLSNSELNKALKKRLQHSLGNHAVAPRSALDANIYQALQHKQTAKTRSRQRLDRLGKTGLVILLGLSISLFIEPVSQTSTRLLNRVKNVAHHLPPQLLSHRDIQQARALPIGQSIPSDSVDPPPFMAHRPDHQAKVAASQTRERLPDRPRTNGSTDQRSIVSFIKGTQTDGLREAGQVTPLPSHQRRVRLNTERSWQQPTTFVNARHGPKRGTDQDAVAQNQSVQESNYLTDQERLMQPMKSLSTRRTNDLVVLKPITALSFTHQLTDPAIRVVQPPTPSSQTKLGRQLTLVEKMSGLQWLFSVTPLTTRQRVILLPNPQASVQDVRFPQGLTQSAGYKLNMGVEQNGFQLLLSYTQLQMRSDYAYSTDQYVVEENGSHYSVKRIGTPATTTTSLQLAGVAIRKQLDVHQPLLGRLFATIGLEYSRSLDSAPQDFVFVSATAGKTIRLPGGPSLSIGPYVDYSFTQIQPIDQLQIRPYQAGLSVAFKLGQHTH